MPTTPKPKTYSTRYNTSAEREAASVIRRLRRRVRILELKLVIARAASRGQVVPEVEIALLALNLSDAERGI